MTWNQHSKQKVFDRAGLSASARKHFEKTVPLLEMDPTICHCYYNELLWPNWWHFLKAQNPLMRLLAANIYIYIFWSLVIFPENISRGSFEELLFPTTKWLIQVINKKFVVKEKTMQAIFAILAWSLQFLTAGFFPPRDHAGNPFLSSWRTKSQGKSLNCTALLTEVRGDWEMYKNTFNLSGWSGTDNICYRCYASKENSRDCTSSAVWRTQRKTTMDHFADSITEGKQISALFSAPGLQIDCFVIDWLHACDLGVAQDFLGN